jgi:hypothetical protein
MNQKIFAFRMIVSRAGMVNRSRWCRIVLRWKIFWIPFCYSIVEDVWQHVKRFCIINQFLIWRYISKMNIRRNLSRVRLHCKHDNVIPFENALVNLKSLPKEACAEFLEINGFHSKPILTSTGEVKAPAAP